MALQCLLYICYFVSIFIYLRNIVHKCNAMWSVFNCDVFRVFARLQLWKSGRLMNTVNCNSKPLNWFLQNRLHWFREKQKKSLLIYIWKLVFFIAAQTRSPRGESVSKSYCPFSSALRHCRQHSSRKSLPDSVSHAQFPVGSTWNRF